MKAKNRSSFRPAKPRAKASTGEVIRMLRELKQWSQTELAECSGIDASSMSLLENDKLEIGKKRAEQLANAFDVHPVIIMFQGYGAKEIGKAA